MAGHGKLAELARDRAALVCFEATGGQEWRLWANLEDAGICTRQLPPAQIKAFAASLGTRAKTDRIDAELIARFMAFRPDVGRNLPHEKLRLLRALTSKRGQLVETRKRLLAQVAAQARPTVLYESPHRVEDTIADLAGACGPDRRVALCRELTKLHEETFRGTLAEAGAHIASHGPRGEYVIVVQGAPPPAEPDDGEIAAALARYTDAGHSRRDASARVAADLGVAPNRVKRIANR